MRRIFSRIKALLGRFKNLFSGKFKVFLCLLFIMFFGLLSLPKISFSIGDQVISLPSLDISSSDIGNFRRGRDIYSTTQVKATVDFGNSPITDAQKTQYLNETVQTISTRVSQANLRDIDVWGEIEDGNYSIMLSFPNYYDHIPMIAEALTKRGEITFVSSETQEPLDLKDSDIISSIDIAYIPAIQTHLKFTFDPSKKNELQAALSQQYFFMQIDGEVQYQVFQYEQSDLLNNTVRAIPLVTETQGDIAAREVFMNITRTYFSESEPLEFSSTVSQDLIIVPAVFQSQNTQYVAILLSLVFIALTILTFIKFRFRKGFVFVLMLLSLLTFTTAFLKYLSTSISFVFIITFFVLTGVGIVFMWRYLMTKSVIEMRKVSKQLATMGFVLFIISWSLIRFNPDLGRFYDALSSLVVFAIAFMVLGVFNLKVLTEEFILKRIKDE